MPVIQAQLPASCVGFLSDLFFCRKKDPNLIFNFPVFHIARKPLRIILKILISSQYFLDFFIF